MVKEETIGFIKALGKYLNTLSDKELERFARIVNDQEAAKGDAGAG